MVYDLEIPQTCEFLTDNQALTNSYKCAFIIKIIKHVRSLERMFVSFPMILSGISWMAAKYNN